MKSIYLDNGSTTQIDPLVLEEMMPYFKQEYGNASSVGYLGRAAKKAVEKARAKVAKAINAQAHEIYFTSGGTESINWAIQGVVQSYSDKGRHIITSNIEHAVSLNTCKSLEDKGYEIDYLAINKQGLIKTKDLNKQVRDETILISIMFANNEIGTIQPVSKIGEIAKEKGIIFHSDAVAAVGEIKVDVQEIGVDLLSLSAHKFYGPKGVGAIYIRDGLKIANLMEGGTQERGRRPGTVNIPGVVGLGKAIEIASSRIDENIEEISKLRDEFIEIVFKKISGVRLNGDRDKRLSNNVNISIDGVESEALLLRLDLEGIAASGGSACTSGAVEPSHVLMALGLTREVARGSIRFTLGKYNKLDDIITTSEVLEKAVKELRDISSRLI